MLNKEDIILYLCEQRNAEVNECQGQCHLTKQTQANGNDPHKPASLINFNEVSVYVVVTTDPLNQSCSSKSEFGTNSFIPKDLKSAHRLLRPPIV